MFVLAEQSPEPPEWPHVVCIASDPQESGFAWHTDTFKRPCFTGGILRHPGELPLPASTVSIAIDGQGPTGEAAGVDQILSIYEVYRLAPRGFQHLFARECSVCRKNHSARAYFAVTAKERYIHPGAIEALREAHVPSCYMVQPWIRKEDETEADIAKIKATKKKSLPVWLNNRERTLNAQLAYASRWRIRRLRQVG
jgi:hypothetical protein